MHPCSNLLFIIILHPYFLSYEIRNIFHFYPSLHGKPLNFSSEWIWIVVWLCIIKHFRIALYILKCIGTYIIIFRYLITTPKSGIRIVIRDFFFNFEHKNLILDWIKLVCIIDKFSFSSYQIWKVNSTVKRSFVWQLCATMMSWVSCLLTN